MRVIISYFKLFIKIILFLVFTELVEEEVKLYKSLICSPDSYFKSLTYRNSYKSNQTCFGRLYGQSTNVKSIYTGQPRSGGRPIVLNAKKQIKTVNFNNGLTFVWIKTWI